MSKIIAGGLLALFICFATAWASAAEPVARIPYRIAYDGWFTVEATIDGEGPYDFIVDTGSTLTLVFQRAAHRHEMAPTGEPPRRVLGLGGAEYFTTVAAGDIALSTSSGAAGLPAHRTVILENWDPPRVSPHGVIGLDLLAPFAVFVDADESMISLYLPGEAPAPRGRTATTALVADGFGGDSGALYRLEAELQSRAIDFILDLGASGTLINHRAFRHLLAGTVRFGYRSGPGFSTGTRIADAFDNEEEAKLVEIQRIQIDRHFWRKQVIWVHEPKVFEELGVAHRPFGLLGADLFRGRSFLIDFPGQRLVIGPAPTGIAAARTKAEPPDERVENPRPFRTIAPNR